MSNAFDGLRSKSSELKEFEKQLIVSAISGSALDKDIEYSEVAKNAIEIVGAVLDELKDCSEAPELVASQVDIESL